MLRIAAFHEARIRKLLLARGYSPKDVDDHLAQFQGLINTHAEEVKKIANHHNE